MFAGGFVNLYTADIEAATRFYRDLLGFEETFRTPAQGVPEHVELAFGEFRLGLGAVAAARRAHGVDASPGSAAMAIVIWTSDLDVALERLTAAGVPAVRPPQDSGNGNRNALLRDPDGNLLELVARIGSAPRSSAAAARSA
jgi:lactoylglutathione lyase